MRAIPYAGAPPQLLALPQPEPEGAAAARRVWRGRVSRHWRSFLAFPAAFTRRPRCPQRHFPRGVICALVSGPDKLVEQQLLGHLAGLAPEPPPGRRGLGRQLVLHHDRGAVRAWRGAGGCLGLHVAAGRTTESDQLHVPAVERRGGGYEAEPNVLCKMFRREGARSNGEH